ncbi:hypothetical protein ebA7286 [Aromatoleum aromaticum EbN1]|uniref:Uncharacterized protein n=1 Tax=Aromatoleum aromaticum (strain DSM 19018 / LMG 30748 / EbN1) TaxID=76114 RepID=Q5NXG4_AROAE|nr:hypothetical protein ebA7286 [Aromatoleum aromaticum EbN1]
MCGIVCAASNPCRYWVVRHVRHLPRTCTREPRRNRPAGRARISHVCANHAAHAAHAAHPSIHAGFVCAASVHLFRTYRTERKEEEKGGRTPRLRCRQCRRIQRPASHRAARVPRLCQGPAPARSHRRPRRGAYRARGQPRTARRGAGTVCGG